MQLTNEPYQVIEERIQTYKGNLKLFTDEELAIEFDEKIGNETREFESLIFHRGRNFVIEYLAQDYGVRQAYKEIF